MSVVTVTPYNFCNNYMKRIIIIYTSVPMSLISRTFKFQDFNIPRSITNTSSHQTRDVTSQAFFVFREKQKFICNTPLFTQFFVSISSPTPHQGAALLWWSIWHSMFFRCIVSHSCWRATDDLMADQVRHVSNRVLPPGASIRNVWLQRSFDIVNYEPR